jgi:hypothetical protein
MTAQERAATPRYVVHSLGRAGRAALIVDVRSHRTVLKLRCPDQFQLADRIAEVLNSSPFETPVEPV